MAITISTHLRFYSRSGSRATLFTTLSITLWLFSAISQIFTLFINCLKWLALSLKSSKLSKMWTLHVYKRKLKYKKIFSGYLLNPTFSGLNLNGVNLRGLPGEFSESQVLRLIENEKRRKTFNLRRKKCIKRCLQCPCVSSLKKQVNILKKVVFSHLHQHFYPLSSATCKVRGIRLQVHEEITSP